MTASAVQWIVRIQEGIQEYRSTRVHEYKNYKNIFIFEQKQSRLETICVIWDNLCHLRQFVSFETKRLILRQKGSFRDKKSHFETKRLIVRQQPILKRNSKLILSILQNIMQLTKLILQILFSKFCLANFILQII